MADSLPWSCRRGDSSQVERERGLEGIGRLLCLIAK